jgi:hypothetical protein
MRASACALAVVAAVGCATAPPPARVAPAVCTAPRVAGAPAPDATTWIALLLRGVDPATRRATQPALDCRGAQVRWEGPALACEDGTPARTLLPDQPLSPESVIEARLGAGRWLVWIVTGRYATGDAVGPVALVEGTDTELRVTSLGVLRAYPQRARLRLETFGERTVLLAEGEWCASKEAASCIRAARLLLLAGDRFRAEPLLGPDRRCASPAWIDLSRSETRPAPGGQERFDLVAALAFDGRTLRVDEQVVVQAADAPSGATERVLRRAQSQRTVTTGPGDSLLVTGPSLWSRMVQARAPVQP